MNKRADKIFEISWETCNKTGGINTVIRTKARRMVEAYGSNYILIGPYLPEKAKGEFEESVPPDYIKPLFEKLSEQGIRAHWWRWLIPGEPQTVLIDFEKVTERANELKRWLWENYKIDSLSSGSDFDMPILWSWCVSEFLKLYSQGNKDKKTVAHFHEWLAGAVLLFLGERKSVKTVFTTHATFLGRALAGNNFPLYDKLEEIEPEKEARRLGIQAKFKVEKESALRAGVLTTVSEITSMEVEQFFSRKPDLLLPNGLDLKRLPTFEEISLHHRTQRDRMREFLLYYFFPYYPIEVRDTLFFFISGRYELRNKGIDIFIRALGELNKVLKKKKNSKTIVTFFWIPSDARSIKPEIIEQRELFNDLLQTLKDAEVTTESNLIYNIVAERPITKESLFNEPVLMELKKKRQKLMGASGNPPLCTHELGHVNDPILEQFQENELTNDPEDKVKVIFYPIYLTGSDGLLNLNYKECVQGAHLGVFCSYYEPWGYTPLETASLGVPAVTSDLAGFGRFINDKIENPDYPGIYIVDRFQKEYKRSVADLAEKLKVFACYSRRERVEAKIAAMGLAEKADWGKLVTNYIKAHNLALKEAN